MATTRIAPERAVAELIDRLGRVTHGAGFTSGLNPAQWTALRYFERANRFSCTVSAFADYHGTTRGTASQTVKALVEKGFLRRRPAEIDQRSFRLTLTSKALRHVADDPIRGLVEACEALTGAERTRVAAALDAMLDRLRGVEGQRRFGACGSCRNLCRSAGGEDDARLTCRLLDCALGEEELDQICVNFEPGDGSRWAAEQGAETRT